MREAQAFTSFQGPAQLFTRSGPYAKPTKAHVVPPLTCGVRAGGARVGCPRTAEPPRRRSPESHHEHEAQTAAAPPRSHYSAAASSPPFEGGDCGDRPRHPRPPRRRAYHRRWVPPPWGASCWTDPWNRGRFPTLSRSSSPSNASSRS